MMGCEREMHQEKSEAELYDEYCEQERLDAARENREPVLISDVIFKDRRRKQDWLKYQSQLPIPTTQVQQMNEKDYDACVLEEPSTSTSANKDEPLDLPDMSESDSGDEKGEIIEDQPEKQPVPWHLLTKTQRYYMAVGKKLLKSIKDKKPFIVPAYSTFKARGMSFRRYIKKRRALNKKYIMAKKLQKDKKLQEKNEGSISQSLPN